MSDMIESLVPAGSAARVLRVTVTNDDGEVLSSERYQVPAGTTNLALYFGEEPEPIAQANCAIGEVQPEHVVRAL